LNREGRQGREGKQGASLVVKITDPVIELGFTLVLISLASFASLAVKSFFQENRSIWWTLQGK
jgi:hypothetical protein